MKMKTYHIAVEILCVLFIILFGYTAMSKSFDHKNFEDQLVFVTENNLVGSLLSYLIPIVEFVVAILLCFHRTRLIALYFFCSLMVCFSAYIIYLMLSGRQLPCTCGGVISAMTWKQHLIFNGGFIVAGIATIIFYTTKVYKPDLKSINKSF